MSDSFYIDFEKRFRGSPELIKERLSVYLPYIVPLKKLDGELNAIDMGCGRGEWIQLMSDNGFRAKGFDLNDQMIESCKSKGLDVEKVDILNGLKKLPSNSQLVVSAFHLVEHLHFERLRDVITESLRVLRPEGFLILETPNPENIMVATLNFHLDPTHHKPIPPLLLSFICEHAGFAITRVLRLGENSVGPATLNQILGISGINQDYAVIAQKSSTGGVYSGDYHLYRSINSENPIAALLNQQEIDLKGDIEVEIKQSYDLIMEKVINLELLIDSVQFQLNLIMGSRSWRWTKPFRNITKTINQIIFGKNK